MDERLNPGNSKKLTGRMAWQIDCASVCEKKWKGDKKQSICVFFNHM